MVSVISVDPGAKGAICLFAPDHGVIEFRNTTDKPGELYAWLVQSIQKYDVKMAGVEKVHSIFGTSAKSNFSFGFNVGMMYGLIQATGIGLDEVQPKAWQKFVGVPAKSKTIKQDVAAICGRLYPQVSVHGPRGGLQDGKSDSLLIAHYFSVKYSTP